MFNEKPVVVVGMSGGVDSSVSAYLLKEQGYHVIGLFMKNWEEESTVCPAAQDFADTVTVCDQLDIPYYSVNFAKEYWERVFTRCLEDFKLGFTPNPDIFCNREIKFDCFLKKALDLGADYIATGHYAQIALTADRISLLRGVDPEKDQSYFLYTLKSEVLQKTLFPVGGMMKKEVRALAEKRNLITAKKKDSTGICFIGKRDFRDFLSRYITPQPGFFKRLNGEIVGEHQGIAFYTIGQRKGLTIGGAGDAWFVVGKEISNNVVFVEQGEDHPALYSDKCGVLEVSWVHLSPTFPLRCTAKIRYRSPDVPCNIVKEGEKLIVHFETPQKAVTPRQAIVFYQGPLCLGGGLIE